MAELRYNPLIKDWVMIASHRQDRPQMPKDWCPFCPGNGKIPETYDVMAYPNDFPALSTTPPIPDNVATDFYKTKEAYGKCEVVLYSPNHNATLSDLADEHVKKIVDLWQERFAKLSEDEKIKYILIFENRGDVVGVTMPHPHGQIYGYSVVPKKIELEKEACQDYFKETGDCLICKMLEEEKKISDRMVIENNDFAAFVPFFSEYPYGMYVVSKSHKQNITEFSEKEKVNLAKIIKDISRTYDNLFGYTFPYMMCLHQSPVNSENTEDYYHFHIEYFPPMRSADKQKFNASSETGAWAHCNPTAPEDKAEELRTAYKNLK